MGRREGGEELTSWELCLLQELERASTDSSGRFGGVWERPGGLVGRTRLGCRLSRTLQDCGEGREKEREKDMKVKIYLL